MMFLLRSIMVGLGFFGVVYCLLSLGIVCVWRASDLMRQQTAAGRAQLLFGLRIAPIVGAAFITIAFALPAFFLLEGGADEDMGTLLFSLGTLLLFAAGMFRVMAAQRRTIGIVAQWIEEAHPLDAGIAAPTLQAKPGLPPLLLYGISEHKVLVSETAVILLTRDELRIAVRHEEGHIRSRDNLKKLILYAASFPGMGRLERAWQEAAEFAADEAAIANKNDAIDLASALIKLGCLVPVLDSPAFTTGLVDMTALVSERVHRLLAWNETDSRPRKIGWWCCLAGSLAALPYIVTNYGPALLFTHRFTEWLIH